jgi:hypothetical protein
MTLENHSKRSFRTASARLKRQLRAWIVFHSATDGCAQSDIKPAALRSKMKLRSSGAPKPAAARGRFRRAIRHQASRLEIQNEASVVGRPQACGRARAVSTTRLFQQDHLLNSEPEFFPYFG